MDKWRHRSPFLKKIDPLQLQPLNSTARTPRGGEQEAEVTTTNCATQITGTGPSPGVTPPLWHKEFKISGQIGEPGYKKIASHFPA